MPYRTMHSYEIRTKRAGESYWSGKQGAWGMGDALPGEWEAVKRDETIVEAIIYLAGERRRPIGKRKLADKYIKSEAVTA